MTDPELAAMEVLLDELASLDRVAIGRVLMWAAARHGVDLSVPPTAAPKERRSSRKGQHQRSQAEIDALLGSA